MVEEKFEISQKARKSLVTYLIVGIILFGFGVFGLSQGWFDPATDGHDHGGDHAVEQHANGHGDAHADEDHGDHGHGYSYWTRIKADVWHNNMFFTGLALIGVFFLAVNYVSWAGWSASIKRVFESFGYFLVPAGIITIISWFAFNHDLFHWMHEGIFESDPIIAKKEWYLDPPFYIARMFIYFAGWITFFYFLRKESLLEDMNGGTLHHNRQINISAGFIVFFAVSSSMCSWDWIMSIDTHWFSTMFGWYVFASWFVSGLSAITLVVILLKQAGYLKIVNTEHLHDLGKFMFAFSIFWTYIWFSQFILYWYANIPEESVYFVERMFNNMGNYLPVFILNLIINFLFPFLFFMTRDSKRQMILLKIGAIGLLIGHWLDFYLMIMPGTIKNHGGLNIGNLFVELGLVMIYVVVFAGSVLYGLSKASLIAKNHPMLEESIHHHT